MRNQFDHINALRCVAVLMVFCLHAHLPMGKDFAMWQAIEQSPVMFVSYTPAWAGVWIFFIVSGYLAGMNFASGKYKLDSSGIKKYYLRKISKVYVPTLLFVCLCVVMVEPSFLGHDYVWLKMLTCTYNGIPGFDGTGATWFVFTLMWLYLLAPWGAKAICKMNCRCMTVCGGGTLLAGFLIRIYGYVNELNWHVYTYTPPYANLDMFFLGMMLAYWQYKGCGLDIVEVDKPRLKPLAVFVIVAFMALILCSCWMHAYNTYIWVLQYMFPSLYAILTLGYLYTMKSVLGRRKSIVFKSINWFSGISFEFFLFHSLIMGRVASHVGGHTPIEQYSKFLLVVLVITIVFSIGYHRIFEKNDRRMQ